MFFFSRGAIKHETPDNEAEAILFLKNDGTPITNTELKEGMLINAIVTQAPEVWRTSKGLKLFGPKHSVLTMIMFLLKN
jgi:DUF917 family protein